MDPPGSITQIFAGGLPLVLHPNPANGASSKDLLDCLNIIFHYTMERVPRFWP